MKTFTRVLAACICLAYAQSASSQIDIMAGLGLSYGTQAESIGLHIRGDVDITEVWGGSLNFITYFSPFGSDFDSGSGVSAVYRELNFDAHYVLLMQDELTIYPLAGLNLTTAGVKSDINIPFVGKIGQTTTDIGLNIGGGVRYAIADAISLVGELKYILSSADQLVISAAGIYHF